MTEQTPTIPTDQARRARQWARDTLDDVENGANVGAYARDAARTLIAMMPRPTLADMTPEERAECQWMQADVKGDDSRAVIVNAFWDRGISRVMCPGGFIEQIGWERVTPRPDLPRMEWPGTGQDGEVTKVGDVIESAADPRLAALPVGTILRDCDGETSTKHREAWTGFGYVPIPSEGAEFGPWKVLHIGREDDR